ncbi:hypothetical protein [Rathayibacter soli]|uniref:hypothetical protein n=1 Tax=Rathayibacter soli TaxID=3144168 RepID=UPI0027E4509D|nr:hypothetical protein [Glaciibacter superstes]
MRTTRLASQEELPDFTDSEILRELITTLTATDRWATSAVARELMLFAMHKYAPIAKAWHRDPADAGYAAFLAFRTPATLTADDPWAVVTHAVRLAIAADEHADRLMTSSDKARRPSKRPPLEPIRAGYYEEFLYDIHRRDPFVESEDSNDDVENVIRSACVFFVVTGSPARAIEAAVEYICNRISSLSSHDSAMDTLTVDTALAYRLGYSDTRWAALVRLLIGTKPTRRHDAGTGILGRVLLGDTVADLLQDADLVRMAREVGRAGAL